MPTDGRLPAGPDSRGFGSLLKELAEGSGELIRQEVRLARTEAREMMRGLGAGTAEVAVGAVLALLGALALIAGLILLAGDQWLRDRYWLAALLVTVIAGAVAFLFMRRGLALLSPKALLPDQTVATLKEDKEWLRQLRT
ncbi:phage holin family protein [Roseisolibacter sp. H3M3-2]|uniref:phage holin family protein n=1 Tax=Roseisolibacter sp. H3M3-2 TaxID=3031323 RepID=UPI0023D9E0D0|nr:phage holin family protein [Roseisolibacter sp. H3M3-2]MDF1501880.1 phage holin family protein [Roseisolibacter sp. H3M3-2]